ncbi:MAG: hypothetical protein AAB631_01935 [Patescibacteria group bacterium]
MKISDFGHNPYACSFPDCKAKGPADEMWNVKGKPIILCGEHAYKVREHGFHTYRLSNTLEFLEEQKLRENHFFTQLEELVRQPQKQHQKK